MTQLEEYEWKWMLYRKMIKLIGCYECSLFSENVVRSVQFQIIALLNRELGRMYKDDITEINDRDVMLKPSCTDDNLHIVFSYRLEGFFKPIIEEVAKLEYLENLK